MPNIPGVVTGSKRIFTAARATHVVATTAVTVGTVTLTPESGAVNS